MTQKERDDAGRRISDARFRTYFEFGLVGMVASTPDGVFLEVNDRFCELLGYTQSELAGRKLHDVTHPEDRAADLAGLDAVKRGECDRWSLEKRFVGRNDRVIHAIASTAALRRADGAVDHLICLVQDITPQKTAEEELRQRAQVFKAFVENTPDLIARFDRDLRRIYVNPAIEALTGRPASELIGKTLAELSFDARFTEALEQALREAFATGAEATLEVMLPDRSGERVYQARIVPERGVTGQPEYALVISRDITAIRRDQERLHALTREIELANRLVGLGRVASAMSHEFNNVLMGIQPFAEILLRVSTDARVINAARRIIASVSRGRGITESLRAFTRPALPIRTPLDVRSWLSESSAELERLVSSNVQFHVETDETPMAIEADRNQMTQVLSSIIVNAREAIGNEKGLIRLTANLAAGDAPEESFVHFRY